MEGPGLPVLPWGARAPLPTLPLLGGVVLGAVVPAGAVGAGVAPAEGAITMAAVSGSLVAPGSSQSVGEKENAPTLAWGG